MDASDAAVALVTSKHMVVDVINRLLRAVAPTLFDGTGKPEPKIAGMRFREVVTLPGHADAELASAIETVSLGWLSSCDPTTHSNRLRVVSQVVSDLTHKSKRGSSFLAVLIRRMATRVSRPHSVVEGSVPHQGAILGAVLDRQYAATVKGTTDVDGTWLLLVRELIQIVLAPSTPQRDVTAATHLLFQPMVMNVDCAKRLDPKLQPVLSVLLASIRYIRFALDPTSTNDEWKWVCRLDAAVPLEFVSPDGCVEACLRLVVTTLDSQLAAVIWPTLSPVVLSGPEILAGYCRAFETAVLFAGWGWLHDEIVVGKLWRVLHSLSARTSDTALLCSAINLCGKPAAWSSFACLSHLRFVARLLWC
jgi:hypothetical protein